MCRPPKETIAPFCDVTANEVLVKMNYMLFLKSCFVYSIEECHTCAPFPPFSVICVFVVFFFPAEVVNLDYLQQQDFPPEAPVKKQISFDLYVYSFDFTLKVNGVAKMDHLVLTPKMSI